MHRVILLANFRKSGHKRTSWLVPKPGTKKKKSKEASAVEKKDPNVLRSLQYFEAVARHRSVKLAAIDLGVTQSAVSHQLRRFSEAIGQQLVMKSGRGIALTPAGEKLGERLSVAFAGLDELVKDVVGDGQQVLQLAVCSSFGPGWLIEKLDDFYQTHPEIDLELLLHAQNPLFSNQVADAYIVADEVKPGYKAIPLKKETLMAVEAPASRQRARNSGKRRLITTDLERGRIGQDWVNFCRLSRSKLKDIQDGSFRLCTHYFLALELAKAGHGVALVPDFLAMREIRAGTVVLYHDARLPSGRTYRLCIKDTRTGEAKLKTLTNWLVSVAKSDPA
jgi:DNA-binding transcriptional LysR family regulator